MCVFPVSDTVLFHTWFVQVPYIIFPGPVEADGPCRTLHKPRVLSKKILCDHDLETSGVYS